MINHFKMGIDENHIKKMTSRDMDKICRLFKDVWGEGASERSRNRYNWQFDGNPSNPKGGPAILVMEDHDKIVGLVCGLACLLKVGDQYVPSQWAVDFMVSPEHRGRRGILLSLELGKQSRITMGFPVESSVNLWRRGGGIKFDELVLYLRILNYRNANRTKQSSWSDLICGWGITRIQNAWTDLMSFRAFPQILMREIEKFGEEFDAFWDVESKHYDFIQVRNSDFLNWRFVRIPHLSYRKFAAYEKGRLVGYVITRTGREKKARSGYIVDVFAQKNNRKAILALFRKAVEVLKKERVDFIKTAFITDNKMYLYALKRFGLVPKGRFRSALCYGRNEDFEFFKHNRRLFTLADSDLDFA